MLPQTTYDDELLFMEKLFAENHVYEHSKGSNSSSYDSLDSSQNKGVGSDQLLNDVDQCSFVANNTSTPPNMYINNHLLIQAKEATTTQHLSSDLYLSYLLHGADHAICNDCRYDEDIGMDLLADHHQVDANNSFSNGKREIDLIELVS
ncbi:Myb transcription factor [Quillaja saponaria]|uniref:Myb transcription factor n=1 Tax=Quillaja saponaria TaxID=32244 RepID=A0AAD7LJR8_QUISA|nr:Myb transcription factor [Quillaja saponaria]